MRNLFFAAIILTTSIGANADLISPRMFCFSKGTTPEFSLTFIYWYDSNPGIGEHKYLSLVSEGAFETEITNLDYSESFANAQSGTPLQFSLTGTSQGAPFSLSFNGPPSVSGQYAGTVNYAPVNAAGPVSVVCTITNDFPTHP